MRKILLMITCLFVLKTTTAQDICITPLEKEVYDLINAYRTEKGLPAVPLTRSLMITANSNVFALSEKSMVVRKPAEFGYTGAVTGQVRTSFSVTTSDRIFANLTQPGVTVHYKVIGNLDEYSTYQWKAMGICIRTIPNAYTPTTVFIVFGNGTDEVVDPVTCDEAVYFDISRPQEVKKPVCPIVKFRASERASVFTTYTDKKGTRKKIKDNGIQTAFEVYEKGRVAVIYLNEPEAVFYEIFVSEYPDPVVLQEKTVIKVEPGERDTLWKTVAFKGNTVEDVQAYLDAGGAVDAVDDRGFTMLHRAVMRNHIEAAALLLDHGANINGLTKAKEVPLSFVQSEEMYDLLMARKPLLKNVDMDQSTLLHNFSMAGLTKAVRYMVEVEKANADAANRLGATPLFEAVVKGRHEVAKYLLDQGAKCLKGWGYYPVYEAVKNNDLQMVALLLLYDRAKAQLNLVNGDGSYPIIYAVIHGHLDMVKLLVENGADLRLRETAEYSAIRNQSLLQICNGREDLNDIRDYLLAAGAK